MTKGKSASSKIGIFFFAVGTALLLAALLWFFHNRVEDQKAGERARSLLANVGEIGAVASLFDAPTGGLCEEDRTDPQKEKTETAADGEEILGTLEISALGLILPVLPRWDDEHLKIAPCRQFGSLSTDDLVIAAHNYKSHFGNLQKLAAGDPIFFTDADGMSVEYTVKEIRVLSPTEVDLVRKSGFALTLYTCTYSGKDRITVFCERKSDRT